VRSAPVSETALATLHAVWPWKAMQIFTLYFAAVALDVE